MYEFLRRSPGTIIALFVNRLYPKTKKEKKQKPKHLHLFQLFLSYFPLCVLLFLLYPFQWATESRKLTTQGWTCHCKQMLWRWVQASTLHGKLFSSCLDLQGHSKGAGFSLWPLSACPWNWRHHLHTSTRRRWAALVWVISACRKLGGRKLPKRHSRAPEQAEQICTLIQSSSLH